MLKNVWRQRWLIGSTNGHENYRCCICCSPLLREGDEEDVTNWLSLFCQLFRSFPCFV